MLQWKGFHRTIIDDDANHVRTAVEYKSLPQRTGTNPFPDPQLAADDAKANQSAASEPDKYVRPPFLPSLASASQVAGVRALRSKSESKLNVSATGTGCQPTSLEAGPSYGPVFDQPTELRCRAPAYATESGDLWAGQDRSDATT